MFHGDGNRVENIHPMAIVSVLTGFLPLKKCEVHIGRTMLKENQSQIQ